MQTDLQEVAITADTVNEPEQEQQQEQPFAQTSPFNDKALELTVNTLNDTINTLSRTIESLAHAVVKPVDTLARTVETLATVTINSPAVEKASVTPIVVASQEQQPQEQEQVQYEEQPDDELPVVFEEQSAIPETKEEQTESVVSSSPFGEFNKSHEKVPFNKKLLALDGEIKNYFSEVHNELISYKKVNYRVSFKGISYRVGRNAVAKIVVRGKTLKLHLALNVNDYSKTVFFQEDKSNVKAYEDVPFTVKIKSNRGKNNAIKLITSLAEGKNLVRKEPFEKEDILKQLKTIK